MVQYSNFIKLNNKNAILITFLLKIDRRNNIKNLTKILTIFVNFFGKKL